MGDENLPQPFEFRQLLDTADAEIMRAAEEELIFLQQLNIHLPTDEPSIEKVIDTVHKLLESSGLNEEGQVAMSAAFREAVVNAAQHGNKYKRDRKIEVQYLLDSEKITTVVKDQGNGFNHEQFVKSGSTRDAISAARERHAQGRMGGLGIMLMLRCCDRLEYNQQGNQLTLTKFLKPQE
jgi:serine/threonine-protein kinase RsbW